jgi:hypothetical protein
MIRAFLLPFIDAALLPMLLGMNSPSKSTLCSAALLPFEEATLFPLEEAVLLPFASRHEVIVVGVDAQQCNNFPFEEATLFPFEEATLLPFEEEALLTLLLSMKISWSFSLSSTQHNGCSKSCCFSSLSFLYIFFHFSFNLIISHLFFRGLRVGIFLNGTPTDQRSNFLPTLVSKASLLMNSSNVSILLSLITKRALSRRGLAIHSLKRCGGFLSGGFILDETMWGFYRLIREEF